MRDRTLENSARVSGPPVTTREPAPFIVGAPRSGTTLLRFILDSHPSLAIPPETGFVVPCSGISATGDALRQQFFDLVTSFPANAPAWEDFHISRDGFWNALLTIVPFNVSEGLRVFYRIYSSRFGKTRWGDKTPDYCLHLQSLEEILPESHFIHLIRDGRDVALSLRQTWFSPGNDIEVLAGYWRHRILTARQQGASCRHYLEVRYEDLIGSTQPVVEQICEFLHLDFDERMLRYPERTPVRLEEHQGRMTPDGIVVVTRQERLRQQEKTKYPPDTSRVFAWKALMSDEERLGFEAVAGDALRELGYETAG